MVDRANDYLMEIAKLDKILILHEGLIKALEGINGCVSKTKAYRQSVNCIVTGAAGVGKTTMCEIIRQQMPIFVKVEKELERTIIPVFYSEIPSPTTIKSVASSLLTQLGDPNPLAGNAASLTKRLCFLLRSCETKLVLLDEFNHLFDRNRTSTIINTKVNNWIKGLVNRTNVCFCLIGLPDFEPIFRSDGQLARRFAFHYHLPNLSLVRGGKKKTASELKPFLEELTKQINRLLDLEAFPQLDKNDYAMKIYAATGGNPSFILSLVKEALINSFSKGRRAVIEEDFIAAWDSGVTRSSSLTKENPFSMEAKALAISLRGAI